MSIILIQVWACMHARVCVWNQRLLIKIDKQRHRSINEVTYRLNRCLADKWEVLLRGKGHLWLLVDLCSILYAWNRCRRQCLWLWQRRWHRLRRRRLWSRRRFRRGCRLRTTHHLLRFDASLKSQTAKMLCHHVMIIIIITNVRHVICKLKQPTSIPFHKKHWVIRCKSKS